MPAVTEKTYSHKSHYTLGELSLQPYRKNEQRLMPGAYIPKTATIVIHPKKARLEIEYSVSETPGTEARVSGGVGGVKILFGRYTEKVLEITFEYSVCDELLGQISGAAKAITVRKNQVSQDSIKRNYQMVAEGLLSLLQRIQQDWEEVSKHLTQNISA